MEDKKRTHTLKTSYKKRRWGQVCLIVAAILNAFVLLINLNLSNLEDELTSKSEEERYFMSNQQTKNDEVNKRTLLHVSLNQLRMLRRLASDRLTPDENQAILMDEKNFQVEINSSLRKAVIVSYLQGSEPSPGKDPEEMFSNMTDEQLFALIPKLEDKSFQYIQNVKKEMVRLMDKISLWKKLYSYSLIMSIIIIIVANFLIYANKEDCR